FRSLYGALVVLPRRGPTYDRDYAVAVGDLNGSDAGDRIGANGVLGDLHLAAHPGDLVRLRLIDAIQGDMTGFPELLTLLGTPYRVIALDGQDLNGPTDLGPELLPIAIAQRYQPAVRTPAGSQVKPGANRAAHGARRAGAGTAGVAARTDVACDAGRGRHSSHRACPYPLRSHHLWHSGFR